MTINTNRPVDRLYGEKRLQRLLQTYCQAVGINNLATAKPQAWLDLYLHICDDFWSQRLSIATFSGLSELLLLPSFERHLGKLEFVLCLAVDLAYYQRTKDSSAYLSSLAELMEFYLQHRFQHTRSSPSNSHDANHD